MSHSQYIRDVPGEGIPIAPRVYPKYRYWPPRKAEGGKKQRGTRQVGHAAIEPSLGKPRTLLDLESYWRAFDMQSS